MLLFADHLSRAFLPNQEEQGEEFQVFGLEIQAFNPFDALSSVKRKACAATKTTEQEPVLQTMKTTILVGWPEQKRDAY